MLEYVPPPTLIITSPYICLAQGNWTGCFTARSENNGLWTSHTLLLQFPECDTDVRYLAGLPIPKLYSPTSKGRAFTKPTPLSCNSPGFAAFTGHFCSSSANCSAPQTLGLQGIVKAPAICHLTRSGLVNSIGLMIGNTGNWTPISVLRRRSSWPLGCCASAIMAIYYFLYIYSFFFN